MITAYNGDGISTPEGLGEFTSLQHVLTPLRYFALRILSYFAI